MLTKLYAIFLSISGFFSFLVLIICLYSFWNYPFLGKYNFVYRLIRLVLISFSDSVKKYNKQKNLIY